ncbi:oligosaccharide flippase family protein [Erwinia sp. INIA-01]|uniref:oligosaccharide flippase family protein n=1 Tax=Erwinia sp. INIA01 TaxID=2991500 RepID=UPI002225A7E0|nr:oligosaccharide flippase family protein [Erwinia sp. INIA01]MCW1874114.1 oligosaccharide flippase family protein [Erwinia sp. INIA01]
MNKSKLSILNIVWYFISNVFPALSAFFIFTFASHSISVIELGSITLCTTVITILINVSAVGFADAIVNRQDVKKAEIDAIFTLIFSLSILFYIFSVSVLFFLVNYGVSPLVANTYPVLGIKLVLDSVSFVPLAILSRKMEFKKIAIRTILCSILSALISVPALITHNGFYAIIISLLTTSLVSFSVLWLSAGYKPRLVYPGKNLSEIYNFGINNSLTKIVNSFNFDNIFLGFFGSLSTLGIYGFGKRVLSIFTDIISSAISNVSYPIYSTLSHGDGDKLKAIYLKTIYFSVLVSMPIFMGLILISDDIVPFIFGQQWSSAVPTIKFFFAFGFLSCIGSLQLSLIKAKGFTGWIFKYQLFQQVTTGILALMLAGYGPEYVIMAIVIKTYLTWPYTIYYISRLLDISVFDYLKVILKPFLPLGVLVISFLILKENFHSINLFLYLFVQIFSCALIYALSTYVFFKRDIVGIFHMIKYRKVDSLK